MRSLPKRLVADGEYIDSDECSTWIAHADTSFGTEYDNALAAEIARRWNAHEALVAALRGMVDAEEETADRWDASNGTERSAMVRRIASARLCARAALRDAGVTP